MPRTSDDVLGRLRFQLSRDQAVEAVIAKVRHSPTAEWNSFCAEDYALFHEIFGELWTNLEREKWEVYAFSLLTRQDLSELLALGKKAKSHGYAGTVLTDMEAILAHPRRSLF